MKRLCLSLGGFLIVGSLWAQTLTVDQAVKQALAYNLNYQTEQLKSGAKQRERDLVWNKLLPTASVSSSLVRANTATTVQSLIPVGVPTAGTYDTVMPFSKTLDPWTVGVSFSTQWTLSLALFKAIDQTVIDYQNSLISAQAAQKKLIRDVKKTFNQLLALQESLKLTQRQIATAEDRYKMATQSYQSGLTSNVAVLQAQVAWQNLKPTLEGQKLAYRQALMGFALLLGLPVEAPLELRGTIELPNPLPELKTDLDWQTFINRRPDVLAVTGSVQALENTVGLQQALLWPTLVVGWTTAPLLASALEPGKDWTKADNWRDAQGSLSISLRWQLDSLVPGLSTWTTIEGIKDQAQQARLALAQTQRAALMDILTLRDQIQKSRQSLSTLALNVDLAQKSYQQTESAYQSGSQTLIDVQNADLQLQSAQYQVLGEKLNFLNGLLDLEYALGASRAEFLQGDPL